MAHDYPKIDPKQHRQILNDKILRDPKIFLNATPVERPRAIITAGQPGAGKGSLVDAVKAELRDNVVTVDPDELRGYHPKVNALRQQHPYTWSGQTHGDASQWATELRNAAVSERKNLILDTTMPRADVIQDLQARGYDVEIRAIATHRLESELGVDNRFTQDMDRRGHGRYVPQEVRENVYRNLPGTLDEVAKQTGVPMRIYDREGTLHFDSRTSPHVSPGRALAWARLGRLGQERLNDLHQGSAAQRQWHRDLPARVPNQRVDPDTTRRLVDERHTLQIEPGVQRLHHEVGGYRAMRPTVKALGVAGAAYGAYDAQHQIDAAIDTARSTREQWLRGGEEAANQAAKTVVTGGAATVGAIPGAAAGALTSPVTGPLGPIAGGIATGGAAAYGAGKLYEDSRLQQFIKFLGAKASQFGYSHFSREGRLLRQVDSLKEDLQTASTPAERARLKGQLNEASAAFGQEAERNGRTFEGRAAIDKDWEAMHTHFPKVDKDAVHEALDKHIAAGQPPDEAALGAYSDAVHQKYPRAMAHEPLENCRALSNEQLAAHHRQYVGQALQDRARAEALAADKDSHNTLDPGWPPALARQRQAARVQERHDAFWRDIGHLGAIRHVYRERGLALPELPAALRPRDAQPAPQRPGKVSLSPEQARHQQLAHEQLGPGLRARGHDADSIECISAAAVRHAQVHAHRGAVRAFHLSKDGEQIAVIQAYAPMSEFSVREARATPAEQHLAQAHQAAHEQAQARTQADTAPTQTTPGRAIG